MDFQLHSKNKPVPDSDSKFILILQPGKLQFLRLFCFVGAAKLDM